MTKAELIERADKLSAKVWPALSKALGGEPPEVQGMVLADLTAMWLAGHSVPGDPLRTDEMREQLIAMQITAIRSLCAMYVEREA